MWWIDIIAIFLLYLSGALLTLWYMDKRIRVPKTRIVVLLDPPAAQAVKIAARINRETLSGLASRVLLAEVARVERRALASFAESAKEAFSG